jgi:hypothetical protein
VYIVSAVFMTDNNNVLGLGVGSNVIDYGTRTDQTYLYSLVPFVAQNPTEVLETQFYVSSTSLFYYIDLFAVDSIVLQPTSNVLGGTFISIAPLGGISAASTTVTLATPGAVVTGQNSSYGALITDYYIGMTNGGTVTLPIGSSLTAGKTYVVKDESGQAGLFVSKRVTVAAYSPNLIDGQDIRCDRPKLWVSFAFMDGDRLVDLLEGSWSDRRSRSTDKSFGFTEDHGLPLQQ